MANHVPQTQESFVRLAQIIGDPKRNIPAIIPISRGSWYRGIKAGKFPKPVRLGEMTAVWLMSDIQKLISDTVEQSTK